MSIKLYECHRCRTNINLKPTLTKDAHGYVETYICNKCTLFIFNTGGIVDFTDIRQIEMNEQAVRYIELQKKLKREREKSQVHWNFVVKNEFHCPRNEIFLVHGQETEYLDKPDMLEVLVRMGLFESKGQARKNWKGSLILPNGYNDGLIGKNPIRFLSTYVPVPQFLDIHDPNEMPATPSMGIRISAYNPSYIPNHKDKNAWYEVRVGWK